MPGTVARRQFDMAAAMVMRSAGQSSRPRRPQGADADLGHVGAQMLTRLGN
jgi:hypothetical protein